jgi:hypothetical protein
MKLVSFLILFASPALSATIVTEMPDQPFCVEPTGPALIIAPEAGAELDREAAAWRLANCTETVQPIVIPGVVKDAILLDAVFNHEPGKVVPFGPGKTYNPSPVPVPAAIGLLMMALSALGALRILNRR